MEPKSFLSREECTALEECISQAEKLTSGEIRVHIERVCEDPFERGKEVFAQLKMHETEEKNGVLVYLAISSKKFAILGDEGINKKVPPDFWESVKNEMKSEFGAGKFLDGLKKGVLASGEKLASFFPHRPDDKDELPNTISFGE
jgi:uncharacterized membrane protein